MNQEIYRLRGDSPDLRSILLEGKMFRNGAWWNAIPRERVVGHSRHPHSIIFELRRITDFKRPSPLRLLWQAIRPWSLLALVLPSVSIFLLGKVSGWTAHILLGCLAFVGVIFFQIAVYLISDVEDYLRLIDLPGPLGVGRLGVLQRGWISAKFLRRYGFGFLALGIVFGLPAVILHPQMLLALGVSSIAGIFLYSAPSVGMKYRAFWGDFLIFLLSGPLLAIGISESFFGTYNTSVLLLGFIFGVLSWGVTQAKHIVHLELDQASGVFTVANKLGFSRSRDLLTVLIGTSYVIVSVSVVSKFLPLSILFFVAATLLSFSQMIKKLYVLSGPQSARLGQVMGDLYRYQAFFGISIWAGLLTSLILSR